MTKELWEIVNAYNAPFKNSALIKVKGKKTAIVDDKSKMITWKHVTLLRDLLMMYKTQLDRHKKGEMKVEKPLIITFDVLKIMYKIPFTIAQIHAHANRLKKTGFIDFKYSNKLKCYDVFFSQQVINVAQKSIKKS